MEGKALCFTGHRPDKLGGYAGPNAEHFRIRLLKHLTKVIERAAAVGYKVFISGGALGVDQIAADAVINCRVNNPAFKHIKLVIARPFPSQDSKWPLYAREKFQAMLHIADQVVDVSPDPYAPWKMQLRNEWMVNRSEAVIAVWNGEEKGGTWNCIQYAIKRQRDILFIHPATLIEKWALRGNLAL